MNSQESSSPPAPIWPGHFKLVQVGDIKATFDANGTLYYDPGSQRLRLYDENGQIRLTVQIHRVHQPKSNRFPKGNQYNILLTHQTKDGSAVECQLHFRSPDEAVRLNLHEFILEERGIEHPGAKRRPTHPTGNAMPVEQAPAAKIPKTEPPRASTPTEDEDLVEQQRQKDADLEAVKAAQKQAEEEISRLKQENEKLRQKDADLEAEKAARKQAEEEISRLKQENEKLRQKDADLEAETAARKQAEEEISRLKQENAKKDQAIVDLTMELLELKRSK